MRKEALLFILFCATMLHAQASSPVVQRHGNRYFYGEQLMDNAAYMQFLQSECPQAFQQYKSGRQCMVAGWALFGTGVVATPAFVLLGAGTSWAMGSLGPQKRAPGLEDANKAMWSLSIISFAALLTSVPLLSVGYSRMHKSVNTYNNQCTMQNMDLVFGLTDSGIGMKIYF